MKVFMYASGLYKVNFWQWLAWKLPRRLVYFVTIRMWAYATTGEYANTEVNTVTVDEALRRWKSNK